MRKPPDYEEIEQDLWRKHMKEVPARLAEDDKYLLKKIKTFVWRFGFTKEAVAEHIRYDPMFSAQFAKEPRRMSYHEKVAAAWLEEDPLVEAFENLPAGGQTAMFFERDGILRQGTKPPGSKSLDFRWQTGKYVVYAAHKYTREGGGNQDSQFNEIQDLLSRFQKANAEPTTVLIAIVDGPYYTSARMDKLRRLERSSPPYSTACSIKDVPLFLQHILDGG